MSYASPGAWPSCPARLFLYLAKAATQVASPGLSKSRRTASTSIWLVFGLILPNFPILRSWFLLLANSDSAALSPATTFATALLAESTAAGLDFAAARNNTFAWPLAMRLKRKDFTGVISSTLCRAVAWGTLRIEKAFFKPVPASVHAITLSLFTCFFKCGRISQEDSAPPGAPRTLLFGNRGFMITFLVKRPRMHKNLPWRVSFFPAP